MFICVLWSFAHWQCHCHLRAKVLFSVFHCFMSLSMSSKSKHGDNPRCTLIKHENSVCRVTCHHGLWIAMIRHWLTTTSHKLHFLWPSKIDNEICIEEQSAVINPHESHEILWAVLRRRPFWIERWNKLQKKLKSWQKLASRKSIASARHNRKLYCI